LAHDLEITAASDLFARVVETPAVQSLARRLEKGGVLSCAGVHAAAQPFFAAVLRRLFPQRSIVVVTEGLKTQESFHQDLATWLRIESTVHSPQSTVHSPESKVAGTQPSTFCHQPLFYPSWEILPHENRLPHADVISERLETLVALAEQSNVHPPSSDYGAARSRTPTNREQESKVVVTSVVALLQRTYPAEALRGRIRTLTRGDRSDPLDLVEWLEEQGYEPEAQVTQKGEIALRGGILDLYPPTSPWPVRLEFFGDELESLRHFDPQTQISREEILSVTIPPAGELGILKKCGGRRAECGVESTGHGPESKVLSPKSKVQSLEPGACGLWTQDSGLRTEMGTLLEYLPAGAILLLCEPEQLAARADEYAKQVPGKDPFFIAWQDFQQLAAAKGFTIVEVSEAEADPNELNEDWNAADEGKVGGGSPRSLKNANPLPERVTPHSALRTPHFSSLDAFRPLTDRALEAPVAEAQRREFFAQLHRWLRQNYGVHVFCNNDGERQRFGEIWKEYGFESPESKVQSPVSEVLSPKSKVQSPKPDMSKLRPLDPGLRTQDPGLRTYVGALSRGFLCEEAKLVVVTDAEIFGRYKVQRPRRLKSPHAQAARSALDIDFTELEEGDYVVHLQHGIGKYLGLQVLPAGAGGRRNHNTGAGGAPDLSSQECLVIEYAPGLMDEAPPKLYVPVTEAHLVSKYVGAGKARPSLNTLGGTRWAKTKEQAHHAVLDVAGELLAIQAARESQHGYSFGPDAPWQREFESAFIYEETPDQMRAIQEAKGDMERPKPMDRLICGDVGFGKTEVAIRAAFKAVLAGKQAAVLVPTTVLAQQHYNTFRERMADYPVRVELLSRFRTRRAQQQVVKDLAGGAVDIVIGTHRLLQDDIAFKDLGLVIVDEEQRFGVMHKERFKMLRTMVDVLTLSATPIPRTLYLALTGARDMSTIQTPPHDRLPVETILAAYDERLIRDVIQRELNRGGQVFFLHNRVLTIEAMAAKLRTLLPQARIVVGHGQMHSDDLEEVMTKFVNGEADVLLSTTIIESGLDIPNANTIIIDRADRFGLSDLYQLRGRVGRYKHQAYAYLLLPRHGGLVSDVRKRLSAIKQYSTLGSGFKIAMRDLEIRGAGNLLGAEQSGHITAVGFELYCQLLKQSIGSLKGEKVKPRVEVQVRFDFLALGSTDQNPNAPARRDRNSNLGRRDETRMEMSAFPAELDGIGSSGPADTRNAHHALVAPESAEGGSRITHHRPSGTPRPSALGPLSFSAHIPFNYISDARQRIEVYRKLAQATDKPALEGLRKELRDRFGPVPAALELLLQIGELKILAADRNITVIEVKDDKLMFTRNNDYVMIGSKFPRLTKEDAPPRLKEIKKLLLALG
jgi:transcription-repair coupling factor (superfamily II helicase)